VRSSTHNDLVLCTSEHVRTWLHFAARRGDVTVILQDLPAKGIEPNRYSWALLMSAAHYIRNIDFAQQASLPPCFIQSD
jgi:hypothetical protein